MSSVFSNIPLEQIFKFPEVGYLEEIIKYILESNEANKYDIFLNFRNTYDKTKVDVPETSKELISFITVDESGYVPEEIIKASKFVFKPYYGKDFIKYKNLFHIPQGYSHHVPATEVKTILERSNNVFFIGNLHVGRQNFYRFFTKGYFIPFSILHRSRRLLGENFNYFYPDSIIQFTRTFNSGMDKYTYANYLNDSKIVLCPPGNPNVESLRIFEAMRAGCIVISEKLPPLRWYEKSPIIQVNNWRQAHRMITSILKEPNQLQDLHLKTLAWYENVCSPAAVSQYIVDIIR